MSVRRRLAFALVAVPCVLVAYACSSDPEPGGETPGDDGGDEGTVTPGQDGSIPGKDGSVPGQDGSVPKDGGDAGDGAPPLPMCLGNPLFADGGTPDGGANVDAAAVVQILDQPGRFLDGPQWVGQGGAGFLVFSEFDTTERLRRMAADGGALVNFRTAGLGGGGDQIGPIGSAIRNGFIVTAGSSKNNGTSVLLQTAFDGGAGPNLPIGALAMSPNDIVIGKNGSIYFTDPRYQAGGDPKGVYYTAADGGGVTRVGAGFNGEFPNGIALSPDGTKLYIAFTDPRRIDSYPVNTATGVVTATATPVVIAANIGAPDALEPDGLAVDIAGNLWVAEANPDPGVKNGRVEVFRPNGQKWGQLTFATQRPTGIAFGGPDNKTVFITVAEGVYSYVGRCAGLP